MKLDTEFVQLPIRFDVGRMACEVAALGEMEWKPHPQGFNGNTAISLISVDGDPKSDAVRGAMRPTPLLERCPYIRQVLASFKAVLGRARLMRISGQSEAHQHVDSSYYWLDRVRIHIPVVTWPEVRFTCGQRELHMAEGECWIFDTWRQHNVINSADRARIHLVADTVGSAEFWQLVEQGHRPFAASPNRAVSVSVLPFNPEVKCDLVTETVNFPAIMSPWEQKCLIDSILEDVPASSDSASVSEFRSTLEQFQRGWKAQWSATELAAEGLPHYRNLLADFKAKVAPFAGRIALCNNLDAVTAVEHALIRPALDTAFPGLTQASTHVGPPVSPVQRPDERAPLCRPIFILAAPRSGSTLLFETLARSPDLVTIGGESHYEFEGIAELDPKRSGYESNRLNESDATEDVVAQLKRNFAERLSARGATTSDSGNLRLLEKTPKNALRVAFLRQAFPDAHFIFLHRQPRGNLSSIIDAWRSGRFVTYPRLPGWDGPPWSLLLPPGWQMLRGRGLGEIAAAQYMAAHSAILEDLRSAPRASWSFITYEELIADPQGQIERLCRELGIRWELDLRQQPLPQSKFTLTPPDPDKWRKNASLLEFVLPEVETLSAQVTEFAGDRTDRAAERQSRPHLERPTVPADPPSRTVTPTAELPSQSGSLDPLRCSNSNSFPRLLNELGISLVVSTYQAGRLIALRANGDVLNAHFCTMPRPMGMAYRRGRLAVGCRTQIALYENQPEAANKIAPAGRYDACFLPRSVHTTGDIRIHELGFAGDELWIVNTRFSCLATINAEYNFVPRWRPPFISALAPEDRCHLNGLAVAENRPKYVTCHSQSDVPEGWRAEKAAGGCLIDVESNEVLLHGLSMPHSPRWHADRLFLLESGRGTLATVAGGKLQTVSELPGFTRGLSFYKHYAFVGLSKVRESAVFSGIPITENASERACGVWVIDLRTGKTAAFLRFESGVHEVFAVQVLPAIGYPEIATDESLIANSFHLPPDALREVPVGLRA